MSSIMTRVLAISSVTAALLDGGPAASVIPMNAASQISSYYSCTYPYVCFYDSDADIVLRLRAEASDWLIINRADLADVSNASPNAIYLRFADGTVICVPSDGDADLRPYGRLTALASSSGPTCEGALPAGRSGRSA